MSKTINSILTSINKIHRFRLTWFYRTSPNNVYITSHLININIFNTTHI